MTIRTNPPGAQVFVDDYEVGTTPVSTNFIYYGRRKIRIVKDGFETLTVIQPIYPPWYQIPPLDFFSENLTPGRIRDERTLDFNLLPQVVVPTEQLLSRGEELRRGTQSSANAAPPRRVNPAPRPVASPPAGGAYPAGGVPMAPPIQGSVPMAAPVQGGVPFQAPPVQGGVPFQAPPVQGGVPFQAPPVQGGVPLAPPVQGSGTQPPPFLAPGDLNPPATSPGAYPPGTGGQPTYALPPGR